MRLAPMLGRAQQAFDLTFNADIRPTVNQIKSSRDQFKDHIMDSEDVDDYTGSRCV
ncbi:hypothetical protein BS17DRAFT_779482 [Gyrodon lividus]|nr:hypothetical protein BS17DRAFT_779482 [Gyrodon lividus]